MTKPLAFHYQYFEQRLATQRRKNALGIPIGNGWYGVKDPFGFWKVGRYDRWGQGPKHPNGYTSWIRLPKEGWKFCPYYTCAPGLITWNPQGAQNSHLRVYGQSQRGRSISSSIYSLYPSYGGRVETIRVQGEGDIAFEHDPDGHPLRLFTANLPVKKVWDKEKYLKLRRKRVKAERILRSMCKMGAFETEKLGPPVAPQAYQQLLQQLVDDDNPNPKIMELLARAVQGRMNALQRHVWTQTNGTYTSKYILPTPEEAFASLRDELREETYKLEKVYTYEPFDDGRHSHRFDP